MAEIVSRIDGSRCDTAEGHFAEALGEFLVSLAGGDADHVRIAAESAGCCEAAVASTGRIECYGEIYAAEMLWSAKEKRRAAGLSTDAHAVALAAVETLLENRLEDLHRAADFCGAMGLGAGKAVS